MLNFLLAFSIFPVFSPLHRQKEKNTHKSVYLYRIIAYLVPITWEIWVGNRLKIELRILKRAKRKFCLERGALFPFVPFLFQRFFTARLFLHLLSIETNRETKIFVYFPSAVFLWKMEIYLKKPSTEGKNFELSGVGGVLNKCLYAGLVQKSLWPLFPRIYSCFFRLNIDLFTTFFLLFFVSPYDVLLVNSLYYCPHVQMKIIFLQDMSINWKRSGESKESVWGGRKAWL